MKYITSIMLIITSILLIVVSLLNIRLKQQRDQLIDLCERSVVFSEQLLQERAAHVCSTPKDTIKIFGIQDLPE